jgi:uncharacterized membrane protein
MLVWKTLHVLSMVMMVTLFIGTEIFYAASIVRRDVRALAWVQRTVEQTFIGFIALGGILAGIIFGLITAATGGLDFTAGWLIVAYVLVAAFFVNGALIGSKVVRVGQEAVAAEEAGRPLEEVTLDVAPNLGLINVAINAVLFAAIITDMVLKPF